MEALNNIELSIDSELVDILSIGAIACSRLKFLEKSQSRAREHTVPVRKRC